jgi:hypothetical protein
LGQFAAGVAQVNPMRLVAVSCPQLDQLWLTKNLKRARAVASLISRIAPLEFTVKLQQIDTDLPRQYISSPLPVIIDRRLQRGKHTQPYTGPVHVSTLDVYEGRGQQFTPLEKQRTFLFLKQQIKPEYWVMLGPVGAMLNLPRSELPPRRAMKKLMKEASE